MKTRINTPKATKGNRHATSTPPQEQKINTKQNPTEEAITEFKGATDSTSKHGSKGRGDTQSEPTHVELTHPSARRVCIAGTFNDWEPAEMIRLGGDKWAIDLTLPRGSYEYRLIVDGNWMADPTAPHTVPNPFGEPNSLLVVPADAGKVEARENHP